MRREIGIILLILAVFALFELFNIVYFGGAASNISSSLLSSSSHPGFTVLRSDPSTWFLMNAAGFILDASSVENGSNITNAISSDISNLILPSGNETNVTETSNETTLENGTQLLINVSYRPSIQLELLQPDGQYVNPDNTSENVSYSVVSYSPSQWAEISISQPIGQYQTLKISAARIYSPHTSISSQGARTSQTSHPQAAGRFGCPTTHTRRFQETAWCA